MAQQIDPIKQLVIEGIAGGYAISAERIRELRERSSKEITTLKTVFWIAIGLFNLMVWNPFPAPIPSTLRWLVGLGSLLVALFFPIIGIRRHRARLYQLEDCGVGLKRRKTDDAGRQYMDKVKQQGRVFVRAEFEVLQGEPLP